MAARSAPQDRLQTVERRGSLPSWFSGAAVQPHEGFDAPVADARLRCVVVDDPERKASSSSDLAHPVSKVHTVVAAAAFDRSRARRKNDHLSPLGGDHFGFRLGTGLLLHQNKFATFIIDTGLSQRKGQ